MKDRLKDLLIGLLERARRHRVKILLGVFVAAATYATLIMPALGSVHRNAARQSMPEIHTHTADCHAALLNADDSIVELEICGYADYVIHTHTAACYDPAFGLVCPLPEIKEHIHDESCYTTEKQLICALEEQPAHVHTDECYEAKRGELLCELEEHVHTDECYAAVRGELACELSEHEHTEDCYGEDGELLCELEEHVHTDECYTVERGELICEREEHTHTDECYAVERGELICGLEETEGHKHGGECYLEVPVLICTEPQVIEHTHTEDCYGEDGELVCDLPETKVFVREAVDVKGGVDFNLDGYTYHLNGGASVSLAELLGELGLAIDPADIADVSVSDDSLITLSREEREGSTFLWFGTKKSVDWTLESLRDYDTPETLTLTLTDGRSMEISVTVSGITELETENAVISTVNDWFLPEEAGAYSELLSEEDGAEAIAAVEAFLPEKEETEAEIAYQVYDIGLTDVNAADYADGFRVALTLPEGMVVRDFSLYHLRDGMVEELEPLDPPDSADSASETAAVSEITFETADFAEFVLRYTVIEKTILASDGHNYRVSVSFLEDAGVPEGAGLEVTELTEHTAPADMSYADYVAAVESALGWEEGDASYLRLFDIRIVSPDGEKVEIQTPVDVKIELADKDAGEEASAATQVVHFADGSEEGDVVASVSAEGQTVRFTAESFSAYAIVQGPPAVPLGWSKVADMDELQEKGEAGLYIGTLGGFYLRNETAAGRSDKSTTGIVKTEPKQACPDTNEAAKYYFEPVDSTGGQFAIYCLDGEGSRLYVQNTEQHLTLTPEEQEATVFTVSVNAKKQFTICNAATKRYWNMWNGDKGNHIAAWTNGNEDNSRFYLWDYLSSANDPFELNGTAYGLMSWEEGVSGKAMMAESLAGKNALRAKDLTVMSKAGSNTDRLYVPNESGISQWTFHWIKDDLYQLTAERGGREQYLRLASDGPQLVSEPDGNCELRVIPGEGIHAGQICLMVGNTVLSYSGKLDDGFRAGGSAGSEWLYLVELSELTNQYFMTYSAEKVSVSGAENGARVILYTRSWNDGAKKYEYYAVDHDGSLLRCYESGDEIQWVGGRLNTLLWSFVEYTDEDGTPNHYYELYNQYSEQYIAPQVTDGQILSDHTIGVNLIGRKSGRYYSPVVAWDDANYSYAGLKVENGKIVSCPLEEADDFYFAIVRDMPVDDTLTPVQTVDHRQYGITMKIVDIATRKEMSDYFGNDDWTHGDEKSGLLKANLGENGYPDAVKAGSGSLQRWFENAKEVNHLFIDSTYRGTGYFEYDSTQNFASLKGNDFVVYQELGTMDGHGSDKFYTHGQFMPFNDIEAGIFASVNTKNTTAATGTALSDSDPRKYERLYLVKNPNYQIGVELAASFVQTPDGLDDWDHDIIYEFTGDDDFWLYVDGRLVIDLGGIHDALAGSVNFRTGEVKVNGTDTTLRACFEKAYREEYPDAGSEAVDEYLDGIFKDGGTVFRDYTAHTMRIFYFERGSGASNLHMRFNLASVKPNTVHLTKQLSGVDSAESVLAEFPYQIFYTKGDREYPLKNHIPNSADPDCVFYKDTVTPVKFSETVQVGGVPYDNVFFLKPGETAEINFPVFGEDNEGVDSYRVVECGVNADIYRSVSVNQQEITGVKRGDDNRADYGIPDATTEERAHVTYENRVNPEALRTLTFTKMLFAEDGETPIFHAEDSTVFSFRLYLGTEFDNDRELPPANMHTYHVRDEQGNYCSWDTAQQKFVSLGESDYSELSPDERKQATFHTSMNGAVSKIPVDYTVEVRQVLAGTRFCVQERPPEIPDGYSFQRYDYYADGKAEGNVPKKGNDAEAGMIDTIVSGKDPHVDICNLKGWGLRVNKVWSDADYMSERDATYFAIFVNQGGRLNLIDDSVRQLSRGTDPQTMYWYYEHLPVAGVGLHQYVIREVTIGEKNPTVTADGAVTNPGDVTPVKGGEEIRLSGKQKGENDRSEFAYTVQYKSGEISPEANVRVDTVTNNRPGIKLMKTDWNGQPLANAVFTLDDRAGNRIGTFTSDETGLITVAFLRNDVKYILREIRSPKGYHGLEAPMEITLHGTEFIVSGVEESYYEVTEAAQDNLMPTVTLRNRPYTFRVIKVDGESGTPITGVSFALHRQVTVDGVTSFDVDPMPDYEALVTDESGVVPKLDNTLPAGMYELREKEAADGYLPLPSHIRFTVTPAGLVELGAHPDGVELSVATQENETAAYVMTVQNTQWHNVSVRKTDMANHALTGAAFALYRAEDYDDAANRPIEGKEPVVTGGVDANGVLPLGKLIVGEYRLVETLAPDGYVRAEKAISITVDHEGVTAMQGSGPSDVEQTEENTWQVRVWNNPGYALPSTGGVGVYPCCAAGGVLTALAGIALIRSGKRKKVARRDA